jgi:hypothetical protein
MSVTAQVTNYIKFTGDLENELTYSSGDQADSPAIQELITLSSGDNVLTLPSVEGFTVHGVVVIPPALNEMEAVIKGSTTDSVGITLSAFNTSLLQFGTEPPTDIVLVATTNAAGFRLIWF